jgi:NhaP-type Na+/H+ or K+/H+ antiporter
MLTFVKRAWVPLVVVVAVVLGGVAVVRLRGVFGSEEIFSATARSAEPLTPSHVKWVTYQVYGPSGTTGTVSYLTANALPEQAGFTSLPWSYTLATTRPTVIANVVAQGDSDTIGCRITVDGELKDDRSSAGHNAQVFCLVKAA